MLWSSKGLTCTLSSSQPWTDSWLVGGMWKGKNIFLVAEKMA